MRFFCLLILGYLSIGAQNPPRVDGVWLGTLEAGGAKLRIQLHVTSDAAGKESCSLDSLDQGSMGLPCDNVKLEGNQFSFDVPVIRAHWAGTLSEDGNQLNGTFTQRPGNVPLSLTRQAAAIAPEKPKPPKYDDAMAPVSLNQLKAVLDRDLAEALQHGALSPETGGGVVIGVIEHGARQIFVYGDAKQNSIFEIGSISKTFTGLILAQMVEQHKVTFEEPVRELLPPGTVNKPELPEITLLDLATQHSGLPRMPDNFHPANPEDPYADYGARNLYEFIAKHGVLKPANAGFAYSNLGMGLLGQALSNRAGTSYPNLLKTEVTAPLGMSDTVVDLSREQEARFETGHTAEHRPAHPWKLDALAGAGAIRSTASDMLTYLEAELNPPAAKHSGGPAGATIGNALQLSQELRADVAPGMKIALAWLYEEATGNYWHNGGTGGFSSYAFFNPKQDYAAVVLFNTTIGKNGSYADRLGEHISERLSGKRAISLGP